MSNVRVIRYKLFNFGYELNIVPTIRREGWGKVVRVFAPAVWGIKARLFLYRKKLITEIEWKSLNMEFRRKNIG